MRRVTLLIFDGNSEVNYSAACQININGSHATIDTLLGKDFYKFLLEYGYAPFKKLGLVEVRAAVTPAHLRLLKQKLKDIDTVVITDIEEEECIGPDLKLHWISMTEKKPA